jgi:hypothetical protein
VLTHVHDNLQQNLHQVSASICILHLSHFSLNYLGLALNAAHLTRIATQKLQRALLARCNERLPQQAATRQPRGQSTGQQAGDSAEKIYNSKAACFK